MFVISASAIKFIMDDTYLKSVFWLIVILYTVAVIGVWENFAKPIFTFVFNQLYPFILPVIQDMFRF
jgi:hypothetical protein